MSGEYRYDAIDEMKNNRDEMKNLHSNVLNNFYVYDDVMMVRHR